MKNSPNLLQDDSLDFNHFAASTLYQKIQKLLSAKSGRVNIALSGGNTPLPILNILKTENLEWSRLSFYMVDERCVLLDDVSSNYGNISKVFFDAIESDSYSMVLEGKSYEESALAYENMLEEKLPKSSSGIPQFDLILLGMGDDGHTASLFPNTKALGEIYRRVVVNEVPQLGAERITLTYPVLLEAKELIVMLKKQGKEDIINELYSGKSTNYPMLKIVTNRHDLQWLIG